ncbi:hypothetical protein BN3590_03180 [Clostridium sp. C105KSO15]|nr:hypothetical protein BN3590_03180 [Clostridium sp. C105KSO15]
MGIPLHPIKRGPCLTCMGRNEERAVAETMEHDGDNVVLCGANSYEQKYYFNQQFSSLPESIKQDLQIMCVLYTEDVGGILVMEYDEDGTLEFKVSAEEGDYLFDEIGSVLKIKQYRKEKRELLESLEMYYRVFYLGEELEGGDIDT